MSNVRLRRLQADYEKLRAFLGRQPRIRLIQAQGTPPERYQLEYQIRGLREVDEQLQTVANHVVEIALPLSYPRLPPQCRMLTPVFHPNIAPHAICIGDHWNAGEPLWSMVARIGEMIAYQSYNTKSPLNGEAARWVENNLDKVPLDKTSFMLDDAQPHNGEQPHDGEPDPMEIPLAGERPAAPPPVPIRPAVAPPPPMAVRVPVGAAPPMAILLPASPRPRPPSGTAPTFSPQPRASDANVPPTSFNPQPPAAAQPRPSDSSASQAVISPPPTAPSQPVRPTYSSAPAAIPNIVIQCGQCGARYSVPPAAGGKKVRCKQCQAILSIPLRRPLP